MLYSDATRKNGHSLRGGGSYGTLIYSTVFVLLLYAVWMDLKTWRISNRLILLGLMMGLSFRIVSDGWFGIVIFLGHIILPVILLFILYHIRGLGAGDIKLFSMISGFLGWTDLGLIVIYSFFIGAALGLPKLLAKGRGSKIHFSIAIILAYSLRIGEI